MLAEQQSVRAYPAPYGINAAAPARLPQPDHRRASSTQAKSQDDTSVNGASVVGRAGLEKEYDRYLRGRPGYKRVAVDSMGRVLGDDGEVARPARRHRSSPRSTPRCRPSSSSSWPQTIKTARADLRPGHPPQLRRRLRRRGRARRARPAASSRWPSQPTYDPKVWVGGITTKQLKRLYSAKAGNPLLFRATQGQFAPGSTWKPIMTAGALNNGFSPSTRLDCSSGFQVGNRLFKNYESESLRHDRLRQGAADLLRHVLLPGRLPLLAEVRLATRPTSTPTTRWSTRRRPSGSAADRDRRAGGVRRPDRRPALEAGVLEVDEGLLLQHRPSKPRDERLPPAVRARVLPRGHATTAPATR